MVGTYHIFSEWLSLIVKTRSSQAVKRLLDLQPETARIVRGTEEVEVPIEGVKVGDLVRIRPGEREAKRHDRSTNDEIARRLEQSLEIDSREDQARQAEATLMASMDAANVQR
jgi:hypothetical protein